MIKPAADGFELICGEASFSGSGEAGDEGVERFLFPTEFEEFFDEDAVFESGLGEVIEVKVGGGKDGCADEGRGVISNGDLREGFSGVGGIGEAERTGGLEADGGVGIVAEFESGREKVGVFLPAGFGETKGVAFDLRMGIGESRLEEIGSESINAIEDAEGMEAGFGIREGLGDFDEKVGDEDGFLFNKEAVGKVADDAIGMGEVGDELGRAGFVQAGEGLRFFAFWEDPVDSSVGGSFSFVF